MTCIVGIEHDGHVTVGVDSASSNGYTLNIRADSKLFRVGPYLFGFTSSWRMGQLLRYRLSIAEPDGWDVDRWMATTFIDAVRETLRAGGYATTKDGAEHGGTFLVGISGRLYTVDSDYQCGHAAEGYDAVGSGGAIALGSLHSTAELQLPPEERARRALAAAAHHTPTVAAPFALDTV